MADRSDAPPAGTTEVRPASHQPPLHGSFTLTRTLDAPPEVVFTAFADPDLRRRWFRLPGRADASTHHMDFREGGSETLRGSFAPMGVAEDLANTATFLEIVPARRLVRAYEVRVDGVRRWAALATTSLDVDDTVDRGGPGGTVLTHTEQYAFLAYTGEGADDVAHLAGGTSLQLNGLVAVVAGLAVSRPTGPSA